MTNPKKNLVILLLHVLLHLQEHLSLCSGSQGDVMIDFMEPFWESNQKLVFEAMQNFVVLHQYQMSCNFKLVMSKEVGD